MTAARLRQWATYASAIVLLAFLIVPLLITIPMSLTAGSTLTFPPTSLSLRWYEELLRDDRWLRSFWTSTYIAGATVGLSCLLGIPAAIGIAWGRFPGRRILYAIIAAPLVLPVVIVGVAAYSFFASVGMVGSNLPIILTHTAMAVPVMVVTVVASLSRFDRTLVRAAQSLGAGAGRILFRIVLPLIAPGVVAGAIIAFIISFDEVVVASFLSVAGDRTLPRMIFSGVRDSVSPAIASVAVLLILFSALILSLVALVQSKTVRAHKDARS